MPSKPNGCGGGCGIQVVWDDKDPKLADKPHKYKNDLQLNTDGKVVYSIDASYTNDPDKVITFVQGEWHDCPLYIKGVKPGTYGIASFPPNVLPVEKVVRQSGQGNQYYNKQNYSNKNPQTGKQEVTEEQAQALGNLRSKVNQDKDLKNLEVIAANTLAINSNIESGTKMTEEVNKAIAKVNESLDLLCMYIKALPGNIAEAIDLHGKPPAIVKAVSKGKKAENDEDTSSK